MVFGISQVEDDLFRNYWSLKEY